MAKCLKNIYMVQQMHQNNSLPLFQPVFKGAESYNFMRSYRLLNSWNPFNICLLTLWSTFHRYHMETWLTDIPESAELCESQPTDKCVSTHCCVHAGSAAIYRRSRRVALPFTDIQATDSGRDLNVTVLVVADWPAGFSSCLLTTNDYFRDRTVYKLIKMWEENNTERSCQRQQLYLDIDT